MTGLIHDLRQALRAARRHPGFSGFVILAMALGIGINGAVFSLVDALLLRPPAVADPARLVHVYSSVPGDFLSHAPMAPGGDGPLSDAGPFIVAWCGDGTCNWGEECGGQFQCEQDCGSCGASPVGAATTSQSVLPSGLSFSWNSGSSQSAARLACSLVVDPRRLGLPYLERLE